MIRRILSIDFDYFLQATKEAVRSFPDGIDRPTELSTLIWASHYLGGRQGSLARSVGVLSDELDCIKRILRKQSSDCPVMIAQSHVHAYDFVHDTVSEDDELRLVNVDMHHDIVNNNEELDCGNWISHLLQEYDMGLTWVANPVSLEMFGLDKDRKENRAFRGIVQKILSKIEEKNYVFDGIFLCRSDIWTPPHLDNAFCSLCDVITDHFNYVMMEKDIRKCRDCETIVQQLKPDFDRASRKQVQ